MNDTNQTDTASNQEQLIDMATTPAPIQRYRYSLVLAEVIFSTKKGVSTHRVQLFSKADVDTFPAQRLQQLQNSAAMQVRNDVEDESFKALEVVLLNILPLGEMSDEEFWGSQANIPGNRPQLQEVDTADVVGVKDNNVVPIQRP
ncbi:hypothetical protein [Dyella sp. ASV21]|uniref:hypothetical protein n=1 Tax=Dyella sp. ASV21 TaxID=2795114 RepID=UPI0018EB6BE8|nr:hypothetical protein [Dyella sp. ASV21]